MTVRFVYVVKQRGKSWLQIQRENEDGYLWEYGEEGLKSYVDETGLHIDEVLWHLSTPNGYETLRASNPKDLFRQIDSRS